MIILTKKKPKAIIFIGKRKKAIARATIKKGTGKITINSRPLESFPRYIQMRIKEPVVIAEAENNFNIDINAKGGGQWGQADASRTAIANALISWFKEKKDLKKRYLHYDRSLVISDKRRTEPHKPSRSSAGPRRTKQQSKR